MSTLTVASLPHTNDFSLHLKIGVIYPRTGISQSTIDKIFDAFFTTKGSNEGTCFGPSPATQRHDLQTVSAGDGNSSEAEQKEMQEILLP